MRKIEFNLNFSLKNIAGIEKKELWCIKPLSFILHFLMKGGMIQYNDCNRKDKNKQNKEAPN